MDEVVPGVIVQSLHVAEIVSSPCMCRASLSVEPVCLGLLSGSEKVVSSTSCLRNIFCFGFYLDAI